MFILNVISENKLDKVLLMPLIQYFCDSLGNLQINQKRKLEKKEIENYGVTGFTVIKDKVHVVVLCMCVGDYSFETVLCIIMEKYFDTAGGRIFGCFFFCSVIVVSLFFFFDIYHVMLKMQLKEVLKNSQKLRVAKSLCYTILYTQQILLMSFGYKYCSYYFNRYVTGLFPAAILGGEDNPTGVSPIFEVLCVPISS